MIRIAEYYYFLTKHFLTKQNKKDIKTNQFEYNIEMEYFIQADFKISHYYPLPTGITLCDLENHEIVKNYNVKRDTLRILYSDDTKEKIKPIKHLEDLKLFKKPEVFFPISKAPYLSVYETEECVCSKCINTWRERHEKEMIGFDWEQELHSIKPFWLQAYYFKKDFNLNS